MSDDLIGVRSQRANEDRLQHTMLADRGGELVERLLFEDHAGLFGVWFDPFDVDDPDADQTRWAIRRQEADDGGGEFAIL